LRVAREVLARATRQPDGLQLLRRALLDHSGTPEQIAALEQAVRESADPVVETHYALALRDVGRNPEAIEWLERATTRKPAFAAAFHELGILFCMMRRYDEAEAVLKRGLEALPTVAELSVELGGVYICRADPGNAKIAFARALVHAPGHVRALHGFGTAFLFEGEFERAADRFKQVLARNPDHTRARLDLAHCLLELGRFDEAVDLLRSVVRAAPQNYGKALKMLTSSGRGRFWLRPSMAAAFLQHRDVAA
jgi:tetratricopeptide (TPR) repeat protein